MLPLVLKKKLPRSKHIINFARKVENLPSLPLVRKHRQQTLESVVDKPILTCSLEDNQLSKVKNKSIFNFSSKG